MNYLPDRSRRAFAKPPMTSRRWREFGKGRDEPQRHATILRHSEAICCIRATDRPESRRGSPDPGFARDARPLSGPGPVERRAPAVLAVTRMRCWRFPSPRPVPPPVRRPRPASPAPLKRPAGSARGRWCGSSPTACLRASGAVPTAEPSRARGRSIGSCASESARGCAPETGCWRWVRRASAPTTSSGARRLHRRGAWRWTCGGGAITGASAPPGRFAAASAARLPFADASFDFILCNNTLPYVCEDRRALAEIARCLGRDGLAMIDTHRGPGATRTAGAHRRAHPELGEDWFDANGDAWVVRGGLPRPRAGGGARARGNGAVSRRSGRLLHRERVEAAGARPVRIAPPGGPPPVLRRRLSRAPHRGTGCESMARRW